MGNKWSLLLVFVVLFIIGFLIGMSSLPVDFVTLLDRHGNSIIALATIAMVIVTGWYAWLTHSLVRLHLEPVIKFGIPIGIIDTGKVFIENNGAIAVINVIVHMKREIEGCSSWEYDWWAIPILKPREFKEKSLEEEEKQLESQYELEKEAYADGRILTKNPSFNQLITLAITYQHFVSGKEYSDSKIFIAFKGKSKDSKFSYRDFHEYNADMERVQKLLTESEADNKK